MNSIFPKLGKKFVAEFYDTLKEMALKIASSSGGVLGISAIGEEEEQYVNLPMIKDPTL